jgi:hypothetical protein
MREQGHSLLSVLFTPYAQGTIRTLSERVYFLSLNDLFGLNPLPFRLIAFLTFVACTILLQRVAEQLTKSPTAAWCATLLWTVNASLAIPLTWSSEYLEMMFALFILADVWLLLRYLDTGDRRFFLAQWCTFLLGFLVLEVNVVYPALATVIVFCVAPRHLKKVLPMFAASAAYMAIHFAVASLPASGPYQLHWDLRIVSTLLTYLNWSYGTGKLRELNINSGALRFILATLLTAGLGAFILSKLRQREKLALLYPAWFVIALSPLLPLRDHIDYEYLTVPTLGLAILGGWALASSSSDPWKRSLSILLAAIYVGVSIPVGLAVTSSFHDRSLRIRDVFHGVEVLSRNQPEHTIYFEHVNVEIFNDLLLHRPFRLIGLNDVYILGDNQPQLAASSPIPTEAFFPDPAVVLRDLNSNHAQVFDLATGTPVDVTQQFKSSLLSPTVDMSDVSHASQLGPTWYRLEENARWMPRQATVTLPGPSSPDQKLHISGFAPRAALSHGPVKLTVTAAGERLSTAAITQPDAPFELTIGLPSTLTGQPSVVFQLEVDKTFRVPGDDRTLGLIVSSISIH